MLIYDFVLFAPGENVGTVIKTKSGKILVASKCRFAYLDWSTGALTTVANVDKDLPNNRFNDGKCDAKGRFWAGQSFLHRVQHPLVNLNTNKGNYYQFAMVLKLVCDTLFHVIVSAHI